MIRITKIIEIKGKEAERLREIRETVKQVAEQLPAMKQELAEADLNHRMAQDMVIRAEIQYQQSVQMNNTILQKIYGDEVKDGHLMVKRWNVEYEDKKVILKVDDVEDSGNNAKTPADETTELPPNEGKSN